jgi:hypothetical protein
MAYFEGRFVMITTPAEARALEHGLTLAILDERRNGNPIPPAWLLELQSALHGIWAESTDRHALKAVESERLSQNGPSRMISAVKAGEILKKTPQAVTADCRADRLFGAVMVRGQWQIPLASVEVKAEREKLSA